MKVLVQRVTSAAVEVKQQIVGKIAKGFLLFIGVQKGDTPQQADYLAKKVANLRIFEDNDGKMNLSIQDVGGEILAISQFTLAGDTSRGNRPGFETAARPEEAKPLYEYFVQQLNSSQFIFIFTNITGSGTSNTFFILFVLFDNCFIVEFPLPFLLFWGNRILL